MKQRLESDKWFGNLTDKLKDLYTDHAFLKTNQKEMFSEMRGVNHRERRTELKTDSYSKDLLFLALFAFCVITFELIMI